MPTAKEVIAYMESLQDDKQRQVLMRFFKTEPGEYGEGDEFLGLKVPQTREVVKAVAKDFPLNEVPELLKNPWHEIRLCGLLILVEKFEKLSAKKLQNDETAIHGRDEILTMYLKYADHANNWDLVDLSVPKILGHWLLLPTKLGDKDYKLKVTDELAKSDSLWRQRMSMEDLTGRRPVMVPSLCRDSPPPPSRPDAQGCWLDAPRNGQAGVNGSAPRLSPATCPRNASHCASLRH